jgi:hypothetical protein
MPRIVCVSSRCLSMRAWFFTFMSFLSIILPVAACGAWVRSYWLVEQIDWHPSNKADMPFNVYSVESFRGILTIQRYQFRDYMDRRASDGFPPQYYRHTVDKREVWVSKTERINAKVVGVRFLGFAFLNNDQLGPDWLRNVHFIDIPYWFIAGLSAIPGIIWLIRKLRRRQQKGFYACAKCGYDLRASKDRCPECGTPIPSTNGK